MELLESYTAYSGRLWPLPKWIGEGAILGLEGGTDTVKAALQQVEEAGSLEDIAAVWLQDWSGQRNFTNQGDLPRVGVWWNWEVTHTHTDLIENCQLQSICSIQLLLTKR